MLKYWQFAFGFQDGLSNLIFIVSIDFGVHSVKSQNNAFVKAIVPKIR